MQGKFNIRKTFDVTYHINRTKGKKYMFISINAEKMCYKIHHLFLNYKNS